MGRLRTPATAGKEESEDDLQPPLKQSFANIAQVTTLYPPIDTSILIICISDKGSPQMIVARHRSESVLDR